MKTKVKVWQEIEISHVVLILPVRYGEEDIPKDFPLRVGDVWRAKVNIDTGAIEDWPQGKSGELSMKVCDEGIYSLLNPNGVKIGEINQDYVPHGVVPGDSGDYVNFEIDQQGVVRNWPKKPDVSKFFSKEDE